MKLNHKIMGAGKPLIILHGLFGMLDNWRTIARLLENKFQCILVDLRNHGRSPHDAEMNYKVMAADVLELISDLKLNQPYLLGHSMGGKVAMELALQNPDAIEKLIIVDISPKKYPSHHQNEIDAIESIDPPSLTSRTEAEELLTKKLGNDPSTIQFILKNISRVPEDGFEWKANMSVIIQNYDHLMEAISSPNHFEKPVLFIRGASSHSVRDADWAEILTLFPNAQLTTLEDAGHWVHADQPEMLKNEVESFLEA